MKKLVFATILSLFSVSALQAAACCPYTPCGWYIDMKLNSVQSNLDRKYDELEKDALEALRSSYEDYHKALTKQNELLLKLQMLSKQNSLLEKEILFARDKDNKVISITIDSVATDKEIDK